MQHQDKTVSGGVITPAELDVEVLVDVHQVSKKFCRNLKKSLWYGLKDVVREIMPYSWNTGVQVVQLREEEFWSNENLTFCVKRGECVGLIGHNGAGKTTLLKMLTGLIKPDKGTITMKGQVGALIALGAGFNPILTGRENIYVNAAILGLNKGFIDRKIEEIIDFAEIREFIDSPVQSYSSGMQVRLGFAVATTLEPDILILDEVLAVGDMAFHAKCFKRIGELSQNCAVIFVSHDLSAVARICDQVIVLDHGKCVYIGKANAGIAYYQQQQNQRVPIQPSIQLHNCISGLQILIDGREVKEVESKNNLSLEFRLNSSQECALGKVLISFYLNGSTQVSQIDLSDKLKVFVPGFNAIEVSLPEMNLASGTYVLNFAVFGADNRQTVIHAIGFATIVVHALPYLGSAYKMPFLLKFKNDLHHAQKY